MPDPISCPLGVAQGAPFLKGALPAGDAFQQAHPALQDLIGFNIHEIGARHPMLGNENGLLVPFQIGQEFRGLALQGSDKFCSHLVILKYHYAQCKRLRLERLVGRQPRYDIQVSLLLKINGV